MLLSFLEQELIQKISSYYYLFHFSLVHLLMFCPQEKPTFLDERESCLETKKEDQRGEQLSDGGCQLEEGVKANVMLTEEAIFVQLHVHKIKSRTHFPHICSFQKLYKVEIFQPTYSSIFIYKTYINLYNRKGITQGSRNGFA